MSSPLASSNAKMSFARFPVFATVVSINSTAKECPMKEMCVGRLFLVMAAISLVGCAGGGPRVCDWVLNPDKGYEDQDVIVGVGTSELAGASISAAKTDAETAALNRIQVQMETEVERLVERNVAALRDLADATVFGDHTLKDINQNYVRMTIRGAKIADYCYMPNAEDPTRVDVRMVLSVETFEMANEIMNSMLADIKAAEARQELEISHEEAMLRLEKVRNDYLNEQRGMDE